MLEALAHAHGRGIVHRDVKPANVLLADGEEISIRLLDFGLAQLADADTLTAHGDIPGTLAYISPERLRGESGGPASDVWAVGVMLWEALAGWHPFWAPSLLATAKKIEAGAPPLALARPDLPKPLVATVDARARPRSGRGPRAAELAERCGSRDGSPRSRPPTPRPALPPPPLARRAVPRALPALFAGCAGRHGHFPSIPRGWPLGLASAAGRLTLLHARGGLALALAVPVFPLGNLSLRARRSSTQRRAWSGSSSTGASRARRSAPSRGRCWGRSRCSAFFRSLVQPVRRTSSARAPGRAAVLHAALVAGLDR